MNNNFLNKKLNERVLQIIKNRLTPKKVILKKSF